MVQKKVQPEFVDHQRQRCTRLSPVPLRRDFVIILYGNHNEQCCWAMLSAGKTTRANQLIRNEIIRMLVASTGYGTT
jgi:hypothetical protein